MEPQVHKPSRIKKIALVAVCGVMGLVTATQHDRIARELRGLLQARSDQSSATSRSDTQAGAASDTSAATSSHGMNAPLDIASARTAPGQAGAGNPNEAIGQTQAARKLAMNSPATETTTPQTAPLSEEAKAKLSAEKALAIAKASGCVLVSYQAQAAKGRGAAHLYAKNQLKLPEEAYGSSHLCVRVDGTPVKYALTGSKKDSILIGAVAKADSVVSVRYCRSGKVCGESCVIPKDEFMDALAGEDGPESGEVTAHWDPKGKGASQEEAAVDHELESMEDALEDRKPGVFSSWLAARQTPACEDRLQQKPAQARNTASVN